MLHRLDGIVASCDGVPAEAAIIECYAEYAGGTVAEARRELEEIVRVATSGGLPAPAGGASGGAAFACASALRLQRGRRWRGAVAALTGRQVQCLQLLAEGHRAKGIAEIAGIKVETVNAHLSAVRRRLGVRTREEAVAVYLTVAARGLAD